MDEIDPEVRQLVIDFIERNQTGRAVKALRVLLSNGSVTTRELNQLGYDHPPRAIGDVKDNGIPIVKEMIKVDGRRMARYRLGTADQRRADQTGRTNFSKNLKRRLIERYGPVDAITGASHDKRALQIDHRIPYRVAGDAGFVFDDIEGFMLLDAKSQRAKSWSCENCKNFLDLRQPSICRSCFWAFPASYSHIAMSEERRADVIWQGSEVRDYEALAMQAKNGRHVSASAAQKARPQRG